MFYRIISVEQFRTAAFSVLPKLHNRRLGWKQGRGLLYSSGLLEELGLVLAKKVIPSHSQF